MIPIHLVLARLCQITTAGADTITDFAVGASGDQIDIDISTVGAVIGGNSSNDTTGQAIVVEFVTGAETLAGDNILVYLVRLSQLHWLVQL